VSSLIITIAFFVIGFLPGSSFPPENCDSPPSFEPSFPSPSNHPTLGYVAASNFGWAIRHLAGGREPLHPLLDEVPVIVCVEGGGVG